MCLVCGTDLHPPNHVTHVAQVVATVLVVIVEFWDFLRDAVTRALAHTRGKLCVAWLLKHWAMRNIYLNEMHLRATWPCQLLEISFKTCRICRWFED